MPLRLSIAPRLGLLGLALTAAAVLLAHRPAMAMLSIDFEQTYVVHPEMQIWDHCLVQDDAGIYHIFYHGIPEATPTAINADHIWRASTPDFIHWSEPEIVLSVTASGPEAGALWAPDVVRDPASGLWWMAYTGVDEDMNQRICMAWSLDLQQWGRLGVNPVLEPDPESFQYYPAGGWAECRDPFLYRDGDLWHLLVSVKLPGDGSGIGAIAHTTATNVAEWAPLEVFLDNDSATPGGALESSQYVDLNGFHHIFFHQYGTVGVTHVAAIEAGAWTLVNGNQIDQGIAPEVETFDGEHYVFTRIGPYQEPDLPVLSYVARIDTLEFRSGVQSPLVYRAPPLAREFASYSGNACIGNPTFGDNPARRGEDPVGLQGHGYFGSAEYFQGPLSTRGSPGMTVGDGAIGTLTTAPFVAEGASLSFLLGGRGNEDLCYVALRDAATDSVLRRSSPYSNTTMTMRQWDLTDLQGRSVYLTVVDSDPTGHLNVDAIVESSDVVTAAPAGPAPGAALILDRGASPNPFNPATTLRFRLTTPADYRVRICDLRGRAVWDTGVLTGDAGEQRVTWRGIDTAGRAAPAGGYLYAIESAGRILAHGKLALVP